MDVMSRLLPVLLLCSLSLSKGQEGEGVKKRDPLLEEEMCRNFSVGIPKSKEFFSPMYPHQYPDTITCFKTILADMSYFVRIDFRDMFHLEPMSIDGKCEYDYLEIRDGDQGYSPLIGKFCGDNFPPMITSSGRALWLRFHSDSTIQYTGFKAVYSYIENPLPTIPDIGPCVFEAGGFEDFIGTDNITEDRKQHSLIHDLPIDCLWTITVEEEHKIYLQFGENNDNYQLEHPNECHLNYIQIFDGKTDHEHLEETFCGSVAESFTSETNVVYVRFYAEKTGIKSTFSSAITALRPINPPIILCDPEIEHDCDDATCIHKDLVCNGVRNCKFGWDEESCADIGGTVTLDFSSAQVVSILIILTIIMGGMFAGMIWNFWRAMKEDKEERDNEQEEQRIKGEQTEDQLSHLRLKPPHNNNPSSVGASSSALMDSNGGCYVPDAGFPIGSGHNNRI